LPALFDLPQRKISSPIDILELIGASLDVVRLAKGFEKLALGTKCTIVSKYDGKYFEVESFDNGGNTIDVLATPIDFIEFEEEL